MAATNFVEAMELTKSAQPSLKAIAEVFGVPQQRLYSVAKQPKEGEVYNARVYNWDAISKFIAKRIGKDGDEYSTFEEVLEAALAKDEEFGQSDKRRGPRGTSTKVMIDLGNGKQMPARRKELNIGDVIGLKNTEGRFVVKMLTETHVVVQLENSSVLTSLSNWTLNQKLTEAPEVAEVTE